MDVLWLTNIPTPYTMPVWRELAKLVDLQVACCAATEFNRSWHVDVSGVPLTVLGARPVRAGAERVLYAPSLRLLPLFRRRPRTVVLDGWESPIFWQARLLAMIYGARVVISYWSTRQTHRFPTGPVAVARRWFFRAAHGVITPGAGATNAVTSMGVPLERITTGFAAVDVERFSAATRAKRAALPPRSGHHFLYVGELIPR